MGKLATLTRAISARSPERQALAAAIIRRNAAAEHLARVSEASENHYCWPYQEKVDEAEKALAKARRLEARSLVAHLINLPAQPGPTVEQATADLASARQALDRATQTRAALDAEQRMASSAAYAAQQAVLDARRAVLIAEGAPQRYRDKRRALLGKDLRAVDEVLDVFNSENCLPPHWDASENFPPTGAGERWRAALARLDNDPDAVLPE